MTHLLNDRLPGLRSSVVATSDLNARFVMVGTATNFRESIGSIGGCHSGRCETMKRLGLKVEQYLVNACVGIKTTGQIESLPNQLVGSDDSSQGNGDAATGATRRPGKCGQAAAIMTSPELAELRTTALDRRAKHRLYPTGTSRFATGTAKNSCSTTENCSDGRCSSRTQMSSGAVRQRPGTG